jgi:hypothetical protein
MSVRTARKPLRTHTRRHPKIATSRLRGTIVAAALWTMLGLTGCREFHLTTSNPDIGPTPAFPGDDVVVTFFLSLIPTQTHTITVFIDNAEHLSVTNNGAPTIPVVVELGDAAGLIATYGEGVHVVHIAVEARESGGSTRTASVGLDLRASQ